MKLNTLKFLGFLLTAFLFSSYIYRDAIWPPAVDLVYEDDTAEDELKKQVLMQVLIGQIGQQHYQDLAINDEFSEKAFDLYLKRLDFSKRFLTKAEVNQLKDYRKNIDDAIQNNDSKFFDLSVKIIDERIAVAEGIYQELLAQPFDFTVKEDINLNSEEIDFVKDEKELRERWRKSLKYQTLERLTTMMERELEEGEEEKTMEEMEADAREKVKKNLDNWFSRLKKLDQQDRYSTYVNSIINIYGPHTGYYPPKDKENFDISMSGRLEGIGARLQEKDGYIKVSSIVPGSASYRQGDLKEGDLILMVGQEDEEPVDIVDMQLDDAVKLIRGPKGSEVRLTVKKVDGSIKVVPIVRDIVIIEETYAKSSVIDNGQGHKVGYIKLPKFYADFSRWNGRSCSKDVAKEVEKLKSEGISGIILDLRNNGGGSLRDAVDMAGLFIEKGPVVQVKGRQGAPQVLSDRDSDVQYDGPLVIMVNQFSASASEILAAAMQDYDRGVVIGSPASFGKGTVQRFFELDRVLPSELEDIKPLGEVKITTQKFYRINGGATQLKGVVPDIVLPDNYAFIETGEKEQEYVMEWDEIAPVAYDKWQPIWNVEDIKRKSGERVDNDETFSLIKENAQRLKKQSDTDVYSLNLENYQSENDRLEAEADKYQGVNSVLEEVKVSTLALDLPTITADSTKNKMNEDWHKQIQKDHYLNEAVNVVVDMASAGN